MHTYIKSIAIVVIFGIVTTTLNSCANSEAASDPAVGTTDPHIYLSETLTNHDTLVTGNQNGSILKIVQRIEKGVGSNGGAGGNNSASGVTGTISKLSDDIGKMAERILETERLIVAVITNQTAAAQDVIANAKQHYTLARRCPARHHSHGTQRNFENGTRIKCNIGPVTDAIE